MLFRPKPERFQRRALQSERSYSERAKIIEKLYQLSDSVERTGALRAIAACGLPASVLAVEALSTLSDKSARTQALCEVAESDENEAAIKAVELLGREPMSDAVIDCLCRCIRTIFKYQNVFYSTSVAGHAASALHRMTYGTDDPKRLSVLLEVTCNATWQKGYDSPSNWAFKELNTFGQNTIDNRIMPELVRRAKETPLAYPYGGSLEQNRYVDFLDRLKEKSPLLVEKALSEIEQDTYARRVKAIPDVLERAFTEEYYDTVAELVRELKILAGKGETKAVEAFAAFRKRPARTLPERAWKTTEYYDSYEAVHSSYTTRDIIGMRSTADLYTEDV